MSDPAKHEDVLRAAEDLRRRTLVHLPEALERLIYLGSTRDYNTGLYHHQGLASRFSEEAACEALADCHREAFHEVLSASLEGLVGQMEGYVRSTNASVSNFVATWRGLEPYRVAVPVGTDTLSSEFVFSNLKVALAILETQPRPQPAPKPGASPRP
ncbi:MAG: hypothetical protein WA192_18965 [Candidatus Acidiferrales bacterium]